MLLENQSPILNLELENVSNLLACNKLSLNRDKTKFMLSIKNQVINPILYMNISIIFSVKQNIGLILSSNLRWNCHINHISRKISRAVGVLNFLVNFSTKYFNICTYIATF